MNGPVKYINKRNIKYNYMMYRSIISNIRYTVIHVYYNTVFNTCIFYRIFAYEFGSK